MRIKLDCGLTEARLQKMKRPALKKKNPQLLNEAYIHIQTNELDSKYQDLKFGLDSKKHF